MKSNIPPREKRVTLSYGTFSCHLLLENLKGLVEILSCPNEIDVLLDDWSHLNIIYLSIAKLVHFIA